MLKKKLRNQKGFTLIEIIAVLVILGILAAVAIPKFMDLQSDAKVKAIEGALAAGGGNAYAAFARELLAGTTPNLASVVDTLNGSTNPSYVHVGDFLVSYSRAGTLTGCDSTKTITVTFAGGPPAGGTAANTYLSGSSTTNKVFCMQ